MKDLSIEEKEKAKLYDEAIERAKSMLSGNQLGNAWIYKLLPELRESEDERIKKVIFKALSKKDARDILLANGIQVSDALAWLKKQDEQKSTDTPKFKVGDYVVNDKLNVTVRIKDITYHYNTYTPYGVGCIDFENENDWHLWTINDAKDGDVLVGKYDNLKKPWIGIFKCISEDRPKTQFDSHCFINSSHHIFITPSSNNFYNPCKGHTSRYALPATKEQRDLLFQKMKEAGYEWDVKDKVLKKIEQEPADKVEPKFKVGDKIVEKDFDECGCGTIIDIKDGKYIFDDGSFICIKEQGLWKLVEQKPTDKVKPKPEWSEEDESLLQDITNDIEIAYERAHIEQLKDIYSKQIYWLKAIKDRIIPTNKNDFDRGYEVGVSAAKFNQWKPTEEQMSYLASAIEKFDFCDPEHAALESIYKHFKKPQNQ